MANLTVTVVDGNNISLALVNPMGQTGPAGPTGPTGSAGTAATADAGTTTTGAAGTSALVTNSGTTAAAVFDFTIPRGNTGSTGSAGAAATIATGTTTTGSPGSSAAVSNSGTSAAAIFDFTIPRGDTGSTGATGAAATLGVGTTTTGTPGSAATVTNSGTTAAAIFDFTIPRGNTGATGATGSTGATGTAATATAGTTTTGAPGSSASVVNSGTTAAAIFDFTIPRGNTGATGAAGTNGTNGAPGSVWYEGSGAPSGATGINGDYYLNVANGDVYLKATGSWSVVGNIKGPAGSGSGDVTGPSGATSGNVVLFDGATGKLIKDGGTLGTAAFTASTAYDVAGAAAAVTPTTLGLVIGTNVQAYDADLTTWAGVTPGTGVATALGNTAGAANGVATYNQLGTAAFTAASTYVPYSGATGAIDLNNQSVVNVSHLAVGTTTVPTILSRFIGDNGSNSRSSIRGYSNDANSSSWRLSKFRGVAATPLVPQSGDSLGKYEFAGYTTTTSDGVPSAAWEAVTTELWSATARGTKVQLKVTANTTTTQAVAMTVDQDKSVSLPGSLSVTGHTTFEGVTSTGATGTGKLVYDTSPTLVTPLLGTPTSGNFSTGTFTWPTFNQNTTGAATGGASGAIAATTLSASSTVSGTGFSTYLASPPAIGGTAAAAGSFTLGTITSQVLGTQSIATTGGTTTFTATSPTYTIFTGTQSQTLVLPNATTLTVGRRFMIDNDSTGDITVNANGGGAFWIMAAGTDLYISCTGVGTSAGTWEKDYAAAKAATGKALTISNTLTLTGTDASSVAFGTGGTVLYSGGALGTPSSGTATNITGLPPAGVTGTALVAAAIGTTVQAYDADLTTWAGITPGTGVGTALAVNVGSAGAVVVNGGALGTPSSGTLTNCTFPTLNQNTSGTAAGLSVTLVPASGGTGVANGSNNTITFTGNYTFGATLSNNTAVTFPTSGTLAILGANTFTGYQTLAENAAIELDAALSADGKYTGIVQAGVAAVALAFGELCYKVTADGRWNKASGAAAGVNTVVAAGELGICVLAAAGAASATTMLMYGNVRADALFDTFTVGAPVYMSAATAGKIVSTAPTGTTDFTVRKVGFSEDGNTVMFQPSPDYITLA